MKLVEGAFEVQIVLQQLARGHGVVLMAGIGTPFTNVAALRASYEEARRALRHASRDKPFVVGPGEVLLFDELTAGVDESVRRLVPVGTRKALTQPVLRATLEAFVAANQNVVGAAQALCVHPNTLRYRLARIGQLSGRDPRNVADLVELIAAARLLAEPTAPSTADASGARTGGLSPRG